MKKFFFAFVIMFLYQCNNEQQLNQTTWYYFEIEDSTYTEVSFDDTLKSIYYSDGIYTSLFSTQLVGNILMRSYDPNFIEEVDSAIIASISKNSMLIIDSKGRKIDLYRLPYKSLRFMRTETYEKEFERRKLNHQ
jgi:hypothetical protein